MGAFLVPRSSFIVLKRKLRTDYAESAQRPCDIRAPMRCPFCGNLEDRVVDSREGREGDVIRRRRECASCERRFTSYEKIELPTFQVVKRDQRREPYDRVKLMRGLQIACRKRPVPQAELERIADSIESVLSDSGRARDLLTGSGTHGHGSAAGPRPGRLRPVRIRVPPVRGCRRFCERVASTEIVGGCRWRLAEEWSSTPPTTDNRQPGSPGNPLHQMRQVPHGE